MDSTRRSDDERFMAEAIRLASRIPRRPWPNPPVGALVVRDGRVVGRGAHHGQGFAHAETIALDEAGEAARGATLYCTLEPCNHHGHTPPCAPRVAASGIARLVVGVGDPNPRVHGGGVDLVRRAGIEVETRVLAEDTLELIWPFLVTRAFERPFVLLKTATSLDGRFAPPPATGQQGPVFLTGSEARRDVHRWRRWCDEVLVGERTMQMDRPVLDGRLAIDIACPLVDPVPAYVDSNLSLDPAGRTRPFRVYTGRRSAPPDRQRALAALGGEVVSCDETDGRVSPASLVAEFARRGGHCLMVEGGPALAASFLASGLVDRWIAYGAPVVLGAGAGWPVMPALRPWQMAGNGQSSWSPGGVRRFHLTRTDRVGGDVRTVYDAHPFGAAPADDGRERLQG